MDIAAMASATHGVGTATTAEADGIMATRAFIDMVMADIETATGTDIMTDYTLATITTISTLTDPSPTDTSPAMVPTMAKPKTATTTEATVPKCLAATTPTVRMPTTMAAVSTPVPTAEGYLPPAASAKDTTL